MNMSMEFGIMGGQIQKRPGAALTARGTTLQIGPVMPKHSIPNSPNESILRPSVPRVLLDAWKHYPAESFSILPVADVGVEWDDMNWALAPAILVQEDHQFFWDVIRCPYCSYWHRHTADTSKIIPADIDHRKQLGPRKAHCFQDRKLVEAIGWTYWLIGVDKIPNPKELGTRFPMNPPAPRDNVDRGQGGVYLIKAGDRYKIGKSQNPPKRIKTLTTGSAYPIEIVHVEYASSFSLLESHLHFRFSRYRTHGEWFAFNDQMIVEVVAAMVGVNS